jgi:DNA polymerase-3 subunit epsilon
MSLILSKKIYDIKEIPKKTGIYLFLDSNSIPIYIGKSLNLYKRVNQHLNSKSNKSFKLKSRFDHIRYLETKSELIALLIESQEIKRNNPILNRKLRKKRENININIIEDKRGYYGLKISKTKENVLTSFQSTRKARNFINYLSEKYNLCKKLNSTHTENHCCHAISLSQNSKKCYSEDKIKSYNDKFQKMKESLILPKKKFLMIEKNYKKPYPFVSVDSGIIEGYGFTDNPHSNYSTNLKRLDFNTKDEVIIVKNYYKKNNDSLKLIYL